MTASRTEGSADRMAITSPEFGQGVPIPARFSCEGENVSPPLAWSGAPAASRAFAIVCDDPDAPRGTWVHWVLYNLPSDACELGAGGPPSGELPSGARQGKNDSGKLGYYGPCPPPGNPHRYVFRLFALDAVLNLPSGVDRADLNRAMEGHVIAEATLMGTYQRRR
jgi:Raf kinase inhibitor-like YbhB/YbcL family protein